MSSDIKNNKDMINESAMTEDGFDSYTSENLQNIANNISPSTNHLCSKTQIKAKVTI